MLKTKYNLRTLVAGMVGPVVQGVFRAVDPYASISYSQEGEDLILNRLLSGKRNGFFVDVGAHHPLRFSNTYFFYKRGWRGINIDAMPGSMADFSRIRPRDINLELGVSRTADQLLYYMFDDPALNGFSSELSLGVYKASGRDLIGTVEIETLPLADILSKYLPCGQTIDFLSVDVEGLDLDVLSSNDWGRFAPRIVLAEAFPPEHAAEIESLLLSNGYRFVARSMNTLFFQRHSES